MDYFKFLPEEITLDILSRVLPIESVLECKLVCTNWRYFVSHHPSFPKMQLRHQLNHPSDSGKIGFIAITENEKFYYVEYNENHDQLATPIERITRFNFALPFENCWIVDSCHGLICLAEHSAEIVWICNPITKQYIELPKLKIDSDMYCSLGFGFISSTNKYKVLRVHYRMTQFVQVHIYTIGCDKGWRNLGIFDPAFSPWPSRGGIFANEALYWLNEEIDLITTFDLAEEKFCQHLSPPPLPPDSDLDMNTIGVLNGVLFYAAHLAFEEPGCNYHIWLLKEKNNDRDRKEQPEAHQSMVWRKEFKIDVHMLSASIKTNCVLTYCDRYLDIYDTKASTSKNLVDFKEQVGQVIPHINTLVSLKELGEEDTKIMESIEIEETENHAQPSVIREL